MRVFETSQTTFTDFICRDTVYGSVVIATATTKVQEF